MNKPRPSDDPSPFGLRPSKIIRLGPSSSSIETAKTIPNSSGNHDDTNFEENFVQPGSSSRFDNLNNPTDSSANLETNEKDFDEQDPIPHFLREQDRFLPLANIGRIMKRCIPENAKIAKDTKETMQECVSEFISFIASEASDKCVEEKRRTINGEDFLYAMQVLGFDNYIEPLKIYLNKYRSACRTEKNMFDTTIEDMNAIEYDGCDQLRQNKALLNDILAVLRTDKSSGGAENVQIGSIETSDGTVLSAEELAAMLQSGQLVLMPVEQESTELGQNRQKSGVTSQNTNNDQVQFLQLVPESDNGLQQQNNSSQQRNTSLQRQNSSDSFRQNRSVKKN